MYNSNLFYPIDTYALEFISRKLNRLLLSDDDKNTDINNLFVCGSCRYNQYQVLLEKDVNIIDEKLDKRKELNPICYWVFLTIIFTEGGGVMEVPRL